MSVELRSKPPILFQIPPLFQNGSKSQLKSVYINSNQQALYLYFNTRGFILNGAPFSY